MNKKLQVSAAVLVLAFSSAAYAEVEGHFERTLKVTGHIDLDVQSGSGNITVHPGDSSSVVVRGHIRAGNSWFSSSGLSAEERVKRLEQNPPIEQNGNSIRIGHIQDEALRNVSISYDLTVPKDTSVQSRTGSGDEHVSDVNGPVRASLTAVGDSGLTGDALGAKRRRPAVPDRAA